MPDYYSGLRRGYIAEIIKAAKIIHTPCFYFEWNAGIAIQLSNSPSNKQSHLSLDCSNLHIEPQQIDIKKPAHGGLCLLA